jgi:hypothetical protein
VLERSVLIRAVLAGLFCVFASWAVLAAGIAGVTRNRAPAVALRWLPDDARALTNLAFTRAARTGNQAAARKLAQRAIARDATLPDAFTTLGLTDKAASSRARALIIHSEQLSRRDLPTQLWLIEDLVRRNDIRGALLHYDIALRTSKRAPEVLFPVLASAISDKPVRDQLIPLLDRRPPWRRDFILFAVDKSPVPEALADLLFSAARSGRPLDPDAAVLLVTRLVTAGKMDVAWRLYGATIGTGPSERLVRNGGFESRSDGTSFDWVLTDEYDVWAKRAGAPSGGLRLELGSGGGAGGSVARQLLKLEPGQYELGLKAGRIEDQPPAQVNVVITCAPEGHQLQRIPLRTDTISGGATQVRFTVPKDKCPAQWLLFDLRGDEEPLERAAWVDSVSVRAISRGGNSRSTTE